MSKESTIVAEPTSAPPEQLRRDEPETPLQVGGRNLVPERNWVGKPVPRREDSRLLRGEARYGDDLQIDALHLAFVRSPHAHARIRSVSYELAREHPAFIDGFDGTLIEQLTDPVRPRALKKEIRQFIMAVDKVRYVGEPVAVVVAETPALARDLADLVEVDYDVLPPLVDPVEALDPDSPLLFEDIDNNILVDDRLDHGEFEAADDDIVVEETYKIGRFSSTPLEPFVIIAEYDHGNAMWGIIANDQQPGRTIENLARVLRTDVNRLRTTVPDSGGSFGIKLAMWPYMAVLALAAQRQQKPVKWVQTRTEHLLCGTHTPDIIVESKLRLGADGRFKHFEIDSLENDGAFIHTAGIYGVIKFASLTGQYLIPATGVRLRSVVTNQPPVVQNRGVGKPPVTFVLERTIDAAARAMGIDRLELRRRNLVPTEMMPYETPSGEVYESGNFSQTFNSAVTAIDVESFRELQEQMREQGRYFGIGLASGIEAGTSNIGYYALMTGRSEHLGNSEGAMVTIEVDGTISARTGSVDSGQGHVTTITQIIADAFGVTPDDVVVPIDFDSSISPYTGHSGVYSNRFNDVDVGALLVAADKVKRKAERIAEHLTDTAGKGITWVWKDGKIAAEDGSVEVPTTDVANIAYKRVLLLPEDVDPGLRELGYYQNRNGKITNRENFNIQLTHAYSSHACIVEVNTTTGQILFHRYLVAHDVGAQLNPLIVEGMLIGSTAHGIGSALMEEFLYDDDGRPLSTTFDSYRKPVAGDVPVVESLHFETPASTTVYGSKAAGEGGSITSLAAIAAAVEDALSTWDARVHQLPITPPRVMEMMADD